MVFPTPILSNLTTLNSILLWRYMTPNSTEIRQQLIYAPKARLSLHCMKISCSTQCYRHFLCSILTKLTRVPFTKDISAEYEMYLTEQVKLSLQSHNYAQVRFEGDK